MNKVTAYLNNMRYNA